MIAVLTLVINALTKSGDRRYAVSLEFEKRVWEAKSRARLELIAMRIDSFCDSLSRRTQCRAEMPAHPVQAR